MQYHPEDFAHRNAKKKPSLLISPLVLLTESSEGSLLKVERCEIHEGEFRYKLDRNLPGIKTNVSVSKQQQAG